MSLDKYQGYQQYDTPQSPKYLLRSHDSKPAGESEYFRHDLKEVLFLVKYCISTNYKLSYVTFHLKTCRILSSIYDELNIQIVAL